MVPTAWLGNGMQGGQQATILQDEMATMRQSHGISMKRLQVHTVNDCFGAAVAQLKSFAMLTEYESCERNNLTHLVSASSKCAV